MIRKLILLCREARTLNRLKPQQMTDSLGVVYCFFPFEGTLEFGAISYY